MPPFGAKQKILRTLRTLFYGTIRLLTDGYSWARKTTLQNSDKICDRINAFSSRNPLDFTPRKKFERFPELPLEIRIRIWREVIALTGPRTIELRRDWDGEWPRAITQIPAALHTCRDSRAEALKTYQLCFGSFTSPSSPKTYVSFAQDIFFFGQRYYFYTVTHYIKLRGHRLGRDPLLWSRVVPFAQLERIAMKFTFFANWMQLAMDLSLMPKLREVMMVAQYGLKVFDLGPTPTLSFRDPEEEDGVGGVMRLRAMDLQFQLLERWRVMGRDIRLVPKVYTGTFVKGRGDRWFVKKRGAWPF